MVVVSRCAPPRRAQDKTRHGRARLCRALTRSSTPIQEGADFCPAPHPESQFRRKFLHIGGLSVPRSFYATRRNNGCAG